MQPGYGFEGGVGRTVGTVGSRRPSSSREGRRAAGIAGMARRREFVTILIGRIATVRVVIGRNATVQMEEADCRWEFKCMVWNGQVWNGQTDRLID